MCVCVEGGGSSYCTQGEGATQPRGMWRIPGTIGRGMQKVGLGDPGQGE